jgi:hypothetical protein
METKERKVGRPKANPRTGPLVLGEEYARTKLSLEIGERTAEMLAAYTRWVEKSAGISANEARFKTVDFALREIFRRDTVWQAERRAPFGGGQGRRVRDGAVDTATASGRRSSSPTATRAA